MPIKQEPLVFNIEPEVLTCPVCKCESFTERSRLCEHILLCEKGAPDVPIILNYSTIDVKSENLENYHTPAVNGFINHSHYNDLKFNVPSNSIGNILQNKNNYNEPVKSASLNLISQSFYSTDLDASVNNQLYCDLCRRSFANSHDFARHQISDHPDKIHDSDSTNDFIAVASICNMDKPLKYKINIVKNQQSAAKVIPDKKLSVVLGPLPHEDDLLAGKEFVLCPLCNKGKSYQFKSKHRVIVHLGRVHKHQVKMYMKTEKVCRFCSLKCATFNDLLEHYYLCAALKSVKATSTKPITGMVDKAGPPAAKLIKSYKCCMCFSSHSFKEPEYLDHIKSQHNLNKANRFPKQPRQCIYCGRFLTNFNTLFQHCRECANS